MNLPFLHESPDGLIIIIGLIMIIWQRVNACKLNVYNYKLLIDKKCVFSFLLNTFSERLRVFELLR